eukprot:9487358-Pyramimonas_sp.AAC.1
MAFEASCAARFDHLLPPSCRAFCSTHGPYVSVNSHGAAFGPGLFFDTHGARNRPQVVEVEETLLQWNEQDVGWT